jgi:DNA-binding MarR family transcriptional regulator
LSSPIPTETQQQGIEHGLGYLLARARTALVRAADLELHAHEITHAQGSILLLLAGGKCATAAELSRELYLDSASMTRMVDRLEKRGLLERAARSGDRRVTDLRLTAEGARLGALLPGLYSTVLKRSFAGFSEDQIMQLRSLLTKFVDGNPPCAGPNRRTGAAPSINHSQPGKA